MWVPVVFLLVLILILILSFLFFSKFMKKLLLPFTIIPKIKGKFFIWLILVFSFGQLGIIASIVSDFQGIIPSILNNFSSGNFYTFSIALLAAGIFPFALEYLSTEEIRFRSLKMPTIIASFLLITLMGIKFISLSPLDWKSFDVYFQLFLYLFSLIISVYLLCIENVGDYEVYDHLDDKNLDKLQSRIQKQTATDDRGVSL